MFELLVPTCTCAMMQITINPRCIGFLVVRDYMLHPPDHWVVEQRASDDKGQIVDPRLARIGKVSTVMTDIDINYPTDYW